jgi:septal ring factor EnvC (AmiA/AmiB activator)
MRLTLLVIAGIFSMAVRAQTPEASQLRDKRIKLQKEMKALKQSLSETRKHRNASLRELSIMQKQIRLREEQLYSYQHKNNFEFLNFIFSASSFNKGNLDPEKWLKHR